MKDLEALGWSYCPENTNGFEVVRKDYQFGNFDLAGVCIVDTRASLDPFQLWINTNAIAVFPTLALALNAANALACVTPDNPKGRWVE